MPSGFLYHHSITPPLHKASGYYPWDWKSLRHDTGSFHEEPKQNNEKVKPTLSFRSLRPQLIKKRGSNQLHTTLASINPWPFEQRELTTRIILVLLTRQHKILPRKGWRGQPSFSFKKRSDVTFLDHPEYLPFEFFETSERSWRRGTWGDGCQKLKVWTGVTWRSLHSYCKS